MRGNEQHERRRHWPITALLAACAVFALGVFVIPLGWGTALLAVFVVVFVVVLRMNPELWLVRGSGSLIGAAITVAAGPRLVGSVDNATLGRWLVDTGGDLAGATVLLAGGVALAWLEVSRRRRGSNGGASPSQAISAAHGGAVNIGSQAQGGRDAFSGDGNQIFTGPTTINQRVHPSQEPREGGAEVPPWVNELYKLLCEIFTADELRRFVRFETDFPPPRTPPAPITDVADDVATAAHRCGVKDDFFDALVRERKSREPDIEAVRATWRNGRSSSRRSAPRYAMLVLDRVRQWDELIEACIDSDDHLIVLVHGDHEQDVDLFMARMKRYLPKRLRSRREHDYFSVKRTVEHPAITGKDWAQRVTDSTELGRDLHDALRFSTEEQAAVFVLEDYGHPLSGLGKEEFDGLHALFEREIRPTIAKASPAHPLRFVLPFQHPADGKTMRRRIAKLAKRLAAVRGMRLVKLDELTLPLVDEVLSQIKRDFAAHYDALRPKIERLYEEFEDVDRTPEQSIRVLGERLQVLIDEAIASERELR